MGELGSFLDSRSKTGLALQQKDPFREKVNCNHIMLTSEKNNNNILM